MSFTHQYRKNLVRFISITIFLFSETQSLALNLKNTFNNGNAVIQLGGYWGIQGTAQHININGLIGDDFSKNKQNSANGLVGFGLYHLGYDIKNVNLFYGINAFYFPHTTVSGLVTQEDLFTNLSYHYSVTHWPIYLAGKANIKNAITEKINMTLDTGLGINFITTSNFYEQSLDGGVTSPDSIFSGRNKPSFTAMGGIGLRLNNVFGKMPVECGYRFFYLGKGGFNPLTSQTTNTLNTGNSYANALICSVSIS